MTSIKRFLILLSLAAVTLVNFVAALQGYRSGLAHTEQLLDQQLIEKALLLSSHFDTQQVSAESSQLDNSTSGVFLYQLFDANGLLLHASSNAPGIPLVSSGSGLSIETYNGFLWRVYALESRRNQARVIVAEEISNRYSVAESIVLKTVFPIVIALIALSLIIWLVVSLGLRPIRRLANEVGQKKSENLSPISLDNLPSELQPLLLAMNNLLGRLEASFEREQRFSSDAAHELRTPLSAIKVNLFNLRNKLENDDSDLQDMNASVDRMSHLIDQLLMLYRTTSEQTRADFREIDVYEICRTVITENYRLFAERKQEIELLGHSACVTGNELAISALIKNLLDNASKYTPEEGSIKVHVGTRANKVCLVVEDSGIGIPEELTSRVLDRFYRISPDGGITEASGCGLGLSIVKHVADMHDASIFMGKSHFDNGLQVEVMFPKAGGESQ